MAEQRSDADVAFELILQAIHDIPHKLQRMIDAVVAVQSVMPMPRDGWEAFKQDVEHTNEKHGYSLEV